MTIMFGFEYESMAWAAHVSGTVYRTVDQRQHSSMMGTISLPFWAWGTGFVKISIATMLLRFQQSQPWKYVIYVMISFNIVLVLFTGVGNLFQCIPYQASWDFKNEYPNKKCWSPQLNVISMYVASSCNITSDVVFSLMPLTFLGKIRRPMKEKIVIGILMALGLTASTFSAMKAALTNKLIDHEDRAANVILVGMLSTLEVQTALIAACIPTLRSSCMGLMVRLGLKKPEAESRYLQYGAGSSMSGGRKGRKRRVRELDRVDSATGNGSQRGRKSAALDLDDDDDDAQYDMDPVTGRIVCTSPRKTAHERTTTPLSDDDDAQYDMDPVTGRIICTSPRKIASERTTTPLPALRGGPSSETSPTKAKHSRDESRDTLPVNPSMAHVSPVHTVDMDFTSPLSPLPSESSFNGSDNGRWSRYWPAEEEEEGRETRQAVGVAK
jgi:hypothetical protein